MGSRGYKKKVRTAHTGTGTGKNNARINSSSIDEMNTIKKQRKRRKRF